MRTWSHCEAQRPRPPPQRPCGRRRIDGHLARGPFSDGLVFDAVRVRLIEIGEAVKDVSVQLLDRQPHIPWRQVAAMRDQLAHRYFDTSHAIVEQTVTVDLAQLVAAVSALLDGST